MQEQFSVLFIFKQVTTNSATHFKKCIQPKLYGTIRNNKERAGWVMLKPFVIALSTCKCDTATSLHVVSFLCSYHFTLIQCVDLKCEWEHTFSNYQQLHWPSCWHNALHCCYSFIFTRKSHKLEPYLFYSVTPSLI